MKSNTTTKSKRSIPYGVRWMQEEVWNLIGCVVTQVVKTMVEELLKEEVKEAIGAGPYQRTDKRIGHRNGAYKRDLLTSFGYLEELLIPRIREGGITFRTLDSYRRRTEEVDRILGRLFIEGCSTRTLRKIAMELYGKEVSHSAVSKASEVLDTELIQYQTKPIEDTVEFLFLDGITQKLKELKVVNKVMLCAFGIHRDGKREILSFRLVDQEDTDTWEAFLVDLKSRGLLGKSLRLITTDGHSGLKKAISRIYPFIKRQGCIVHKLRNVSLKVRRRNREAMMREVKGIFSAESRGEAWKRFKEVKKRWVVEEERAIRCLGKDLFSYLRYYDFPEELWKTIRSTNILERAFREIRRRTRSMGVFPSEGSANRIMYAMTKKLNGNWALHNFTQNS